MITTKNEHIPRKGRPRTKERTGDELEEIRLDLSPMLKRDLARKAKNRGLAIAQFLRTVLKDFDEQTAKRTEYKKDRAECKDKKKQDLVTLKFRIEAWLKTSLEEKAANRNMYFSEILRDALNEANVQIPEKRESELKIKEGV